MKTVLGYKVTGWHYYPSLHEKEKLPFNASNGCINYGVSHGMGGPLGALSLAYKKGFTSESILEAIDGIIHEYLKAHYYVSDIIYWPAIESFEHYTQQESMALHPTRMSWCYGSVGILRVLFISSRAIARKEIENLAVNEMIKIAQMSTSDYLLTSPIICHGLAGVAAIMKEMYNDTRTPIFLDKALELTEHAVKGYNLPHDQHKISNTVENVFKYDYVNGYTGIIQTIYSILFDIPNGNEKRLLIK